MKNLIVLLMSVLMVTPVMADVEVELQQAPAKKEMKKKKRKPLKACVKMNLSDDQKAQAKEARQMFREETKDMRQRLRKVRRRYRKVLADTSISGERADKLANRRNRLAKKIRDARTDLQHNLVYEIGTDEQRPQILKCLKARKRRQLRRRLRRLQGKNKKQKQMPKMS